MSGSNPLDGGPIPPRLAKTERKNIMTCKHYLKGMCVCTKKIASMRKQSNVCYGTFTNNDEKDCTGYVKK